MVKQLMTTVVVTVRNWQVMRMGTWLVGRMFSRLVTSGSRLQTKDMLSYVTKRNFLLIA